MTTVLPEVEIDLNAMLEMFPYDETDDGKNHKTHIVRPLENQHIPGWHPMIDTKEIVSTARILGLELTALCGYKFIPKRNPENYDACQQCIDIAGFIMASLGQ